MVTVRRPLVVLAVNLGLLALVAAVGELTFGPWLSSDPLDQVSVPRDVRVRVTATGLYPGGGEFLYRRDHWGLRESGIPPEAVTILTMGGSTTNQLYLPQERTWQAVLERAFKAHGRTVGVANAGMDGQSTIGTLTNLESWIPFIPGLKPKIILVYVGINDTNITGPVIDHLKYSSFHKRWVERSAIMRLINTADGWLKARRAKLNHTPVDYAHAEWTDRPNFADAEAAGIRPDPDGYRRRLELMIERIRALGAVPVLVTQARGDARVEGGGVVGLVSADGLNGVDEYRLLARFNAVTLEVCRAQAVACLDLAGELTFVDGDVYDHMHNSPQGAEKVGNWLYGKLAGLVPGG